MATSQPVPSSHMPNPFIAAVNAAFPDLSKEKLWLYDRLVINVHRVTMKQPLKNWRLRLTLRDVRQVTSILDIPFGDEMDLEIPFEVRYSVLMFARIKFDVIQQKALGEHKVARGRKRLREMIDSILADPVICDCEVLCKEFSVPVFVPDEEPMFPRLGPSPEPLGEIKFSMSLSFEGIALRSVLAPTYPFSDCVSISDAQWQLLSRHPPDLQRELGDRFREVQDEAGFLGRQRLAQFRKKTFNEKSRAPTRAETTQSAFSITLTFGGEDSVPQPTAAVKATITKTDTTMSDLGTSVETLSIAATLTTEPRSTSPSPSLDIESHRGLQGSDEWTDTCKTHLVHVSCHHKDASGKDQRRDLAVTIQTHMRPRLRNIFSTKADKVQEVVNGTVAGLLKDGVRIEMGSPRWVRAAKLRDEVYDTIRRKLTYDAVPASDLPLLRAAQHFFRFAFAIYGSLMTNIFSASVDKLFLDVFQSDSDLKRFSGFCSIPMTDIKLWSRASGPLSQLTGGDDFFAPVFALFYDAKTESVVISIRGTHEFRAAFTDLAADFTYTGIPGCQEDMVTHSGFAGAAWRIMARCYGIIREFVQEKKAARLVLTGHSLGAGVANVLFTYLFPLLDELREASGRGAEFDMRVFGFGTPACVDDVAQSRHSDKVLNFVNHGDQVPALSFGSLMDKVRVFQTCDYLASEAPFHGDPIWGKADREQKKTAIRTVVDALDTLGEPKLQVPGKIIYLYPPSDYVESRCWNPPSANPLSKLDATDPELTIAEYSQPLRFVSFQKSMLDLSWWTDYHFPDCYQLALGRAIARLEGRGLGLDGRKASSTEAALEKKMMWTTEKDFVYEPGKW